MTKKEKMKKRFKLWEEFQEGMRNNEPAEVFDDRIIDAYSSKIISKKEYLELMKEIADIRANNHE